MFKADKFHFANLIVISILCASAAFAFSYYRIAGNMTRSFTASDELVIYPTLTETRTLAKPIASVPPLPVIAPKVISGAAPEYPSSALRKGIEGVVALKALVSSSGSLKEVRVSKTSGSAALDEVALNAVRSWAFEPARRGAEAIESWFEVPVRFQITK